MTDTKEILDLCEKLKSKGYSIDIEFDKGAKETEGREIPQTIKVKAPGGQWTSPMAAISFAEWARKLVAELFCTECKNMQLNTYGKEIKRRLD